ncbi:hypothetical protein BGZ61DRAFT_445992 [Ilyonectria robusta]|uniref:uncharacterized protein n=1 Tax=Ilyonectria robusta TaxID=1079257 RepID=UPI001E8E51AF|nr:uncharacterized protein BGZ61DRAFT_445992 [Ilyonectria robusta]KAH8729218.1 hypothetical protein BGZ61DRAFT_445992 [Ilyonectria robusta]
MLRVPYGALRLNHHCLGCLPCSSESRWRPAHPQASRGNYDNRAAGRGDRQEGNRQEGDRQEGPRLGLLL